MTREEIRTEIRNELDRQFQNDLIEMMKTPAGRRFFSYLLMHTGVRESTPTGTYADHYNAGRRSVGVSLTYACDSIDRPTKLTGMQLRHLAESEYMKFQIGLSEDIQTRMDRGRSNSMEGRLDNAVEKRKK